MVEFDRDWDDLPVAELHQLDALCDRFEQALALDAETRIEDFVADVPESQQRLLVLELAQLQVERRHARGQVPTAEEYARRFPQWAEDLRSLVIQTIEDFDRAAAVAAETETVHQSSLSDTWTGKIAPRESWADEWRESTSGRPLADFPADGVLGHYQLQCVIGRGGMGVVVRAHDTRLGRDVALKVLSCDLSHDANAHKRFLREAQAVAGIQHENVVRIFGVEEIDGIPFLAMELVDGITLEEYLRGRDKPSAAEVVSISCQIALGLVAAHKQGLVHRDIKPANILLEKIDDQESGVRPLSTWHVKITDFGLARVAATSQLTSPGVIAGTPQYMSPEQASGRELDVRSDLFSLGSVMYAMCAGQAAFSAESAVAILRQVADVPAPSLSEISPETPGWLVAVIEKLMSKSPDNRFQTASEVAEVLARHEHDLQNGIAPSTSAAPRLIRKRLFAVALLMIALVGLGIAQIVFRVETPHGTLIIKTDDPDVQISVKSGGTEVALFFPRQKKEISLKVGEYTIELVKGKNGLKLSTNKFEIQSGQDQRTVTVEFEPAVVAGKDPSAATEQSTVTLQAKAGDAEKTFAWPEEALWQGEIAAPDLSQAKELYRHDFANTWPTAKGAAFEFGRELDACFISADPGLVRAAWIDDKTYANFACQVVGSVQSKGCQWFLDYTSLTNQVSVRFHLNGLQGLQLAILNDGPPRNAKTIRHNALKKGAEFNKLLVVAIGNRIEIFANDVAICDPIVLEEFAPPGRFALGGVATTIDAVRAEFKSFTIWSAEGLPTLEERLAKGEPYNELPASATSKQIDTPIPPAPPSAIAPFTSAEAETHQQAWAKRLGVPIETENSIGMKLALIPPGEFLMGSTNEDIQQMVAGSDDNARLWQNEGPQHRVVITQPFQMGTCEVTQGQFRSFVEDTGYVTDAQKDGQGGFGLQGTQLVQDPAFLWNSGTGFAHTDNHPVMNVSWNDAVAFCEWLSTKEGITYRLPTEAQWEYACRAGSTTPWHCGDSPDGLHEFAWLDSSNDPQTNPIGQLSPNPWNLRDMHGNVWEWCADPFDAEYYGQSPSVDPQGSVDGTDRVYRGGGWFFTPQFCRAAVRYWSEPNHRNTSIGFRVTAVIPIEPPSPAVAPFGAEQAWAKHLGVPVEYVNSIGLKFRLFHLASS